MTCIDNNPGLVYPCPVFIFDIVIDSKLQMRIYWYHNTYQSILEIEQLFKMLIVIFNQSNDQKKKHLL